MFNKCEDQCVCRRPRTLPNPIAKQNSPGKNMYILCSWGIFLLQDREFQSLSTIKTYYLSEEMGKEGNSALLTDSHAHWRMIIFCRSGPSRRARKSETVQVRRAIIVHTPSELGTKSDVTRKFAFLLYFLPQYFVTSVVFILHLSI